MVDVGAYGKEGDAGIFQKSKMGKLINEGVVCPHQKTLPSADMKLPHVIVGDEAVRLDRHVMKPYPHKQSLEDRYKREYNYVLSRCRRVTENAFGIMCSIFRIFFTPINLKPDTVDLVIFVCCCLHNMLRSHFLACNPPNSEDLDNVKWEMPEKNMIIIA
ncbi:uncharacterized protein LOC124361023 [Homalodisca vitripennis]|uniref:uncharacterized protein LOC124361023 n=1 Tax=Homalodisca vitripennis TaxID=197043 RepID=UPI001EEB455B|nr:uncharacterized protein LOC124361023 [Homalodisca vitripennis]